MSVQFVPFTQCTGNNNLCTVTSEAHTHWQCVDVLTPTTTYADVYFVINVTVDGWLGRDNGRWGKKPLNSSEVM